MDPGAFLTLIARCGLDLQEVDLAQLARRKLVAPWEPEEAESCYTELHLYVVAEYLEAIRPARHPWGTRTAERTVDEIAGLTEEVNRLLEKAQGAEPAGPGEGYEQFILGLERFLARINPFGPMTEVFDLLRPEVVGQMRNAGRLYLEVKAGADALAQSLVDSEGRVGVEEPRTRPMFGVPPNLPTDKTPTDEEKDSVGGGLRSTQVIGETRRRTSEKARQAIDAVVDAAESSEAEVVDEMLQAQDGADEDRRLVEDDRDTEIIALEEVGLGEEESSEPIVLLSEESKSDDETSSSQPPEIPPLDKTGSLEERIAELNSRRQAYMKDQEWKKLAALYEEGIDLFSDPDERRTVFLSLGTLYEAKLEAEKAAFRAYLRAWDEKDATSNQAKTLACVLRMGLGLGGEKRFLTWLDAELMPLLIDDDEANRALLARPEIHHLLDELQSLGLPGAGATALEAFLSE